MEETIPLLLVVDDDILNIKTVENIFGDKCRMIPVKSGELALKFFNNIESKIIKDKRIDKKIFPDLILLDIMMPGIDGYEVCETIKKKSYFKNIPIIFISGKLTPEDIIKGFQVGAVDYVTKPFNTLELKARVNTHLYLKKTREDISEKNLLLEEAMIEIRDKTEKLRQKDSQLLMMDRLAGIGTLAAGIAHEVNTPLGFIKSTCKSVNKDMSKLIEAFLFWKNKPENEFLHNDYINYLDDINFSQLEKRFESKFERIDHGVERIIKIVNSMRGFSRIDMEKIGRLDIKQSINEAIEILKPQNEKVVFEKKLQDGPEIVCVANEVNQSLFYVMKNAVDAIKDNGQVTVETFYSSDNQKVNIIISDNGKGMSKEVLKQVFNPFFTTKPVGSGTGVGLTIAENIIKQHNGTINIDSVEGEGTKVTIVLPISAKSLEQDM